MLRLKRRAWLHECWVSNNLPPSRTQNLIIGRINIGMTQMDCSGSFRLAKLFDWSNLINLIWLSRIWISILIIVSQIDNGLASIQVSSSRASGGLREILYTFEKCDKASSCFGKYIILTNLSLINWFGYTSLHRIWSEVSKIFYRLQEI